jgi:hypothetical protein
MSGYCDFGNPEFTCPVCGYVAKHARTVRECKPVTPQRRHIMVGDLVEKALAGVGITEERVAAVLGSKGGCGCESRKRWLNEQGVKVQEAFSEVAKAAQKFYLGD